MTDPGPWHFVQVIAGGLGIFVAFLFVLAATVPVVMFAAQLTGGVCNLIYNKVAKFLGVD